MRRHDIGRVMDNMNQRMNLSQAACSKTLRIKLGENTAASATNPSPRLLVNGYMESFSLYQLVKVVLVL